MHTHTLFLNSWSREHLLYLTLVICNAMFRLGFNIDATINSLRSSDEYVCQCYKPLLSVGPLETHLYDIRIEIWIQEKMRF